jgi:enoyl-CoA hydratase
MVTTACARPAGPLIGAAILAGMALVRVEREDGVAIVVIDRPPANALDQELLDELVDASERLSSSDVAAVVLTGTDGFFSAGLDLKAVPAMNSDEQAEMIMGVNRLVDAWYGFPRPVVCAVTGHAVAGGLVLALCGDYRIGSTSGKLGLTEVRVGVPYPAAAIAVVVSELDPAAARKLVLGGGLIEPERALELGLVDELAAPADVLTRATVVATELASLPGDTYARVKEQLRGPVARDIGRVLRERSDPMLASWLSAEASDRLP